MEMNATRRRLMLSAIGIGTTVWFGTQACAAPPHLSESDPAAQALSYVEDVSKIDKKRHPQYVAGQDCSSCSLFQGKANDAWAGCILFGNKQVAQHGWCSSYSTM